MTTNFLKQAITTLSPEEFDEAVQVFISERFGYESVNVNGPGDGGNDIKVYQNKKEIKRCIQVTVRKDYKKKLFEDLPKVEKLIAEYNYSPFFEFYCSSNIIETEIDELKKEADEQYGIALYIYDANRLVQLGQNRFRECLLSKYPELQYKTDKFRHSRQERILFDVLSLGNDASDIKNGILYSFIVCAINENESISFKDLKSKIEVLFPNIDPNDLPRAISYLKQENRIDKTDDNKYILTDKEKKCIEDIYISNLKDEQDFYSGLKQILEEYNVSDPDNKIKTIIEKLCAIYKKDIDDKSFDAKEAQDSFQKYIRSLSKDKSDELEQKLEQFCADNDYIQRLTYSESFFSLYKSNKLEDYINEKDNVIFFDTPAFVYYLCSKCTYNTDSWEWDNPLYKYICSLLNICSDKQNVHLKIMNDYINEAAGELKKALQLSWIIDKYPELANTTQTNNSFLEFYRWAKKQDKFEDGIDTFSDFVEEFLGVNVGELEQNAFYAEAYRNFKNISNDRFDIVYNSTMSDFEEHVIVYEKMLDERNGKSKGAIRHDVNQIIYLLNRDSYQLPQSSTNLYLVTWDKTLYNLRDKLLSTYINKYPYEYFYIIQPSKLVNKFAMANFKINNSQLNSSVLAYADKYFGTSSKIKGLLDYIAPLFQSDMDVEKSSYFLTQISKIEKGQLDIIPEVEKSTKSKTSAQIFADVLEFMLPSSEKETNQEILNDKFKQIIFTREGTDYLFDFVKTLAQIERKQWQQQKDDFYTKITFELPSVSINLN